MTQHIPVLEKEVVDQLRAKEGGRFLDCTLGGGGHTQAILRAHPSNHVLALDRDLRAIERAKQRLEPFADRVTLIHDQFSNAQQHVQAHTIDGIIADLGLSTDQLRENRGFSFDDTGDLDMRMNEQDELTASEIVNSFDERELFILFKKGGVGKEARRVARAIVQSRPIETSRELARIVLESVPAALAHKKTHPATVVFQAIRAAVNREFEEIDELLESLAPLSRPSGRLVVISFHSLEDKKVTKKMRSWQGSGTPALWHGEVGERKLGSLLTKKAIVPSEEEVLENPSSRSARMRVFEFSDGN